MSSSTPTRSPDKSARQAILVALLISLLLHQVLLTVFGPHLIPDDVEEKNLEVTLLEDKPKPEKEKRLPDIEEHKKGEPEPKQPEKIEKALPKPTPTPLPPKMEQPPSPPDVAGLPSESTIPEEVPTSPEPENLTPETIITQPKWGHFERAFESIAREQRDSFHKESQEKRRGALRFGSLTGKVRKALSNNRSWVAQGEQVPTGKLTPTFRSYIARAHDRIHMLFADSFLASLSNLDPSDPLNNFDLMTKMEFEILASGQVNEVRVIRTSGNAVFDSAAVDSIYRSSPFPPPPKAILSYNDRVYFRWGFYRNRRKCGIFNAEPYLLKSPGATPEAIPVDEAMPSAQRYQIIDG